MKNKNNNRKSEKGSVTLFVLIAMMFFLMILLSLFVGAKNKMTEQSKKIKIIQNEYKAVDMEEEYLKVIDK